MCSRLLDFYLIVDPVAFCIRACECLSVYGKKAYSFDIRKFFWKQERDWGSGSQLFELAWVLSEFSYAIVGGFPVQTYLGVVVPFVYLSSREFLLL